MLEINIHPFSFVKCEYSGSKQTLIIIYCMKSLKSFTMNLISMNCAILVYNLAQNCHNFILCFAR